MLFFFLKILSNTSPAIHEHTVPIIPYIIKSVGLVAPYACLNAITVVGINVTPAVFNIKNVTISSLATVLSFSGDISCNLLITFNPAGGDATFHEDKKRNPLEFLNLLLIINILLHNLLIAQ